MKPLGFWMYFKNNKKRVTTIILTLVLSSFLIISIGVLGNSLGDTAEAYAKIYDNFSILKCYERKMPKDIIDELNNNPYVERIVKGSSINGEVRSIIGNSIFIPGVELEKEDLNYFLNKMGINIPRVDLDYGDFIGSKMLLNNRGLKVGDVIDNRRDGFPHLEGEKKVKRAYDKDIYMFFILNKKDIIESYNGERLFIFPKEGHLKEMNDSLKKYNGKDIYFTSRDEIKEDTESMISNFNKLLNIFSITVILVVAIILGNSYYLHYMERRSEFGTLKALGYRRSYILKRMIKEVAIVNIIGFSISFLLLQIFINVMNSFYMASKGLPNLTLYKEGIFSLILLPIFVFIFSLIPVYALLSNMDSISIVERMD